MCAVGTGKAGSAEKDVLLLVTQRITANLTGAPAREWAAGLNGATLTLLRINSLATRPNGSDGVARETSPCALQQGLTPKLVIRRSYGVPGTSWQMGRLFAAARQ